MSDGTVVPEIGMSPTLGFDLLKRFPALRTSSQPHNPIASTSTLPLTTHSTTKELGPGVNSNKRARGDDEFHELIEVEEREQQQLIGHLNQVSTTPSPDWTQYGCFES